MTEENAFEVTMLMKAATAGRVDQATLDYFNAALLDLDFQLAVQAATIGTITWRKFPSWAEFKELYRAQQRLAEPPKEEWKPSPGAIGEPASKRGEAAPEWVWVWGWARMRREPRTTRFFPQQTAAVNPEQTMTMDEYEELRKEWVAAGSPKSKNPLAMFK